MKKTAQLSRPVVHSGVPTHEVPSGDKVERKKIRLRKERTAGDERAEQEATQGPETGTRQHLVTEQGATLSANGVLSAPEDFRREIEGLLEDGPTTEGLAKLIDRGESPGRIAEISEPLAETVALFSRKVSDASGFGREKLLEAALDHLTINTDAELAEKELSASDVQRSLTRYARDFGFDRALVEKGKVYALVGDTKLKLGTLKGERFGPDTLRTLGRSLNHLALGVEKTVAPKHMPADLNVDGYDVGAAQMSAQLAGLAYAEPEVVHAVGRAWGFPKMQHVRDPGSDTHAFVLSNDESTVVAFRGTSSRENFFTDLKFVKMKALGGRVHTGFNEALARVWPHLDQELTQAEGKKVIFAGHSLGAALAQMAAKRHADRGGDVHAVYGHGSPRVGNRAFQESYGEALGAKTHLFINDDDIVARVPPGWLGYADNRGTTRWFDDDGAISIRNPTKGLSMERIEDEASAIAGMVGLADQAIGQDADRSVDDEDAAQRGAALNVIPGVSDHSIRNYANVLLQDLLGGLLGPKPER